MTLFGAKVRLLRLRPGDVVVLEAREPLTPVEAAAVKAHWDARFPDVPCAVLSPPLRLGGVVRRPPPAPTRPDPGVPDRRERKGAK